MGKPTNIPLDWEKAKDSLKDYMKQDWDSFEWNFEEIIKSGHYTKKQRNAIGEALLSAYLKGKLSED